MSLQRKARRQHAREIERAQRKQRVEAQRFVEATTLAKVVEEQARALFHNQENAK